MLRSKSIKQTRRLALSVGPIIVTLMQESLFKLYKLLVRTHLEYCNAVVYPQFAKQMNMPAAVQRRATIPVPGIKGLDYHERLNIKA